MQCVRSKAAWALILASVVPTLARVEGQQQTTVTVTAYRAPLGELDSPASTRILDQRALQTSSAITLDGQLRQLPGVELFRRSSSLVANPTSQGMSLRGLGSTAASRTLVMEDDVPGNDPIGGWIHWQETPEAAIKNVEVVKGGASDLYGSSAIGGVINVTLKRPTRTALELRSSYGGEETFDTGALGEVKRGSWGGMIAGGLIGTDGYIQEAPWERGPVDVNSNVHSENVLLLLEDERGPLRLFGRVGGFNENRHNGTPYQVNGTRMARYAIGGNWQAPHDGALEVRLYVSDERFRQTFSSISNLPVFGDQACQYRCGEIPTRFSYVPDNEMGGTAQWKETLGKNLFFVAGAETRDVRIWDREQTYGSGAALSNLNDRQRDLGAYVEAVWMPKNWTVTGAGRVDRFRNFDGQMGVLNGTGFVPSTQQPPRFGEVVFDPRLGVTRRFRGHWALSASGFRAFRDATPNELYRSTQVGNKLTLPNGLLASERATGWETALATEGRWGTIRASYFLTQVNRPIVAVTTDASSSPILLKRENLGQIESRGVALDFSVVPVRGVTLDGGYQYAHATVTRGTEDLGNWIPEVARNTASLNLRAGGSRWGTLSLQGRLSGRQYDDDANLFLLQGYFRMDAYAERGIGSRLLGFVACENLLNREIEVAKTPTTTLGMPRTARFGFQLRLGGTGRKR